jgi:hypothetical protein
MDYCQMRTVALLVIVFATDKAKLLRLEEQIATALQDQNIQAELAGAEPEQIGIIPDTVQIGERVGRIPLLQYRWKIPLADTPDEATVNALRKSLSNLEVQDIHIE